MKKDVGNCSNSTMRASLKVTTFSIKIQVEENNKMPKYTFYFLSLKFSKYICNY